MKVAIVHDWFNKRIGGAEQVAKELSQLYPKAPVFTLAYNHQRFGDYINPKRLHTSFLQKLPAKALANPRYLLPLIPRAVSSLDLQGFDVIISSSSAFVKNLTKPAGATHICYCHTPMRFAWDYESEYLQEQQVGNLQTKVARQLVKRIRKWDYTGAQSVDYFIANSRTIALRIKQYYHRDSTVIYPPVNLKNYHRIRAKENFYLILSGLTPYKKLEVAIEACKIGGHSLKVVGEGSDKERLQKLAGPHTEFLGYVDEAHKRELLAKARALLFPSAEDFGIVPVEAMAAGTPVVAYKEGGLTETIIEGKTGVFFEKQTPECLSETLDAFEHMSFKTQDLTKQAAKFDQKIFDKKITSFVEEVTGE